MSKIKVAAIALITTPLYLLLSVWGEGGFGPFLAEPAVVAVAVVTLIAGAASVFSEASLSTGEREDQANRWVLYVLIPLGLLGGFLPAYCDSHRLWLIGGDAVRWLGVLLYAVGTILRLWPVFVLGRRFSGLVAIQPGHTLVTDGPYGLIRNPSYLGLIVLALGWGLAFDTWIGVLLAALNIPPLAARMDSEERMLASQFGEAYVANGMLAHADETDDFEPTTKAHPGCSIIPAALALAERENRSGAEFIAAVTLGYDLCCRLLMALDPDLVRASHRSAEGTGSSFGAVGAAAALARLDETGMRYALSYAAQQVSGLWSWERDTDHIEKAFDFAGMGARNGVQAVSMVQAGFTGVSDVLDGEQNLISALSSNPHPEQMVADLGSRFYVSESAIKAFSVGYPIQAPLDALLTLRRQYALTPDTVKAIVVRVPPDGAGIVSNSAMPDVNVQHLMAVALIDGTVSFEMSHSRQRMSDPEVLAVRARVQLIGDRALIDPAAPRNAMVEVILADGRMVKQFTKYPPGTKENPLGAEGVNDKARKLMLPVLGAARTEAVIARVGALETETSLRGLIALMTSVKARR